jgi:hypothetical protein
MCEVMVVGVCHLVEEGAGPGSNLRMGEKRGEGRSRERIG